jgi:Peptidase S46
MSMKGLLSRAASIAFLLVGATARAEEGMWTFNNFPSARVAQAYGFEPGAEFLQKVERGSIRLARGCSASLVSARGLVMTNHHCARACIAQLSRKGRDLNALGFYAESETSEIKCPDIEANQLLGIVPVTERVRAATKGKEGREFGDAETAATAAISQECSTGIDIRCDVVKLYHGGQYDLYKYRRFQDVRLVFAPEESIAFFGGDPDNFEFPRYNLDVAFLRIYVGGKPFLNGDYLPLAATNISEGQLLFTSGNPGGSSRTLTVAELVVARDFELPRFLLNAAELRGLLTEFQKDGAEARRISNDLLFGVMNAFKGNKGRFDSLVQSEIINAKRDQERVFRERVAADPDAQRHYGGAWDAIETAVAKYRNDIGLRYEVLENRNGPHSQGGENSGYAFRSTLFDIAKDLVRRAEEAAKPNEQRLREYADANFPIRRQKVLSPAPIYDRLETLLLTFSLGKLREYLGPDDEDVKVILGPSSPEQLAAWLIKETKLKDVGLRQQLLEGGKTAIDASKDPLIMFFKRIDPRLRAVRGRYEEEIAAPITLNAGLIATAYFKLEGTSTYPDATFSPRVSFGTVKGYVERGRAVHPITYIGGTFDRATDADPYRMPPSWRSAKGDLNLKVPFNFASTNDIIGGNSGSPVIDKDARIVGLIFDGNIHSLGGEYGYDAALNRAVALDVGAIREALAKVYKAARLLKELNQPGP